MNKETIKKSIEKSIIIIVIIAIFLFTLKFIPAQENSTIENSTNTEYLKKIDFENSFKEYRDSASLNYAKQDDLDHLTKLYYSKLGIEIIIMLIVIGFFAIGLYWLKLNKHKFAPKQKKTFHADNKDQIGAEAQKIINENNKRANMGLTE